MTLFFDFGKNNKYFDLLFILEFEEFKLFQNVLSYLNTS